MDNLCRTCVKSFPHGLDSIFIVSRLELRYAEMIKECTSVNITEMDELPKLICVDCQSKLEISYAFKNQCLQSEQKLKEIFEVKTIPNQPDEIIDVFEMKNFDIKLEQIDILENTYENEIQITETKSFPVNKSTEINLNKCNSPVDNQETLIENYFDDSSVNPLEDNLEGDCNNSNPFQEDQTNLPDNLPKLKCERCYKPFHDRELLAQHLETHSGDLTPVVCYICGKGLQLKRNLRRHMRAHNIFNSDKDTNLETKCNRCGKPFHDAQLVAEHLKTHDNDLTPCKCFMCGRGLQSKRNLKQHLLIHDSNRTTKSSNFVKASNEEFERNFEDGNQHDKANLCDQLESNSHLKTNSLNKFHLNKFSRAKKINCKECSMKGFNHESYKKHLIEEHPAVLNKCEYCDKLFISIANLKWHARKYHQEKSKDYPAPPKTGATELLKQEKLDKETVCKRCLLKCDSKELLAEHLKSHLNDPMPFICRHCGKGLKHGRCYLVQHMKIHTGEISHVCPTCGKSFRKAGNLVAHIRQHTDERPYSCNVCDARFRQRSTLRTHLVTHEPIKPCKCEICGKRFTRKTQLQFHTNQHLGLVPKFPCHICGKIIAKREMNKHLRYHTGEKLHVCSICSHAFHQSSHLRVHMITHTGEKPFYCKICGRKFSIKHVFEKHMKTHQ